MSGIMKFITANVAQGGSSPTPSGDADPNYLLLSVGSYSPYVSEEWSHVSFNSRLEFSVDITIPEDKYNNMYVSGNYFGVVLGQENWGDDIASLENNLTVERASSYIPDGFSFNEDISIWWDDSESVLFIDFGQIIWEDEYHERDALDLMYEVFSNEKYIGDIMFHFNIP